MSDAGSPVERVVTLPGQGHTVVWDCLGPPGAPTLMLVHGATMTAELNWSAVFPVLSQHFRVLAFDQRGHGRGLGCTGAYRLEQCADDIAELATVLSVERLIVVGYSMGGLIAQLCWRRHPGLTAGLVLCATARSIAGPQWARWATLMMPVLVMPAAGAGLMPWMADLRADLIGTHMLDPNHDRAERAWALGQMRRTPLLTALSAVSAVYAFSSHDWIGGMDVPTAVIITRHDRVVSAARQRRLAAAVPGALVYGIDGEHDVFLTAPGRFAAAVRTATLVTARPAPEVQTLGAAGEPADCRHQRRRCPPRQIVSHAGQHKQLSVGERRGGDLPTRQLDQRISFAVHHQGRRRDASQ
jgi:3-oxoadipate enol-lactonase